MPFKSKAWLERRELFRAKFATVVVPMVAILGLTASYFAEPVEAADDEIIWPLDESNDFHDKG